MSQWADDEALMGALAAAVADEREIPPGRRDAARAAFAWRTIDQDLMSLVHDSSELAGSAVRGADRRRVLSFETPGLTLEVEVDGSQLVGQVLPPARAQVTLEPAGGDSHAADADEVGLFTLPARPGPVRFTVVVDGATRRTEWVVI